MPNHEILDYFMRFTKMIIILLLSYKPINLCLFLFGSTDDILADILLLEIGGLEFLYFYLWIVVLL
jgi:hypothetical protein